MTFCFVRSRGRKKNGSVMNAICKHAAYAEEIKSD